MRELLTHAVIAVECENSLWKARMMPAFDRALTPQARLNGQPGLPKKAVAPTVIVKEEDRGPLRQWQVDQRVPLHIWHAFFDLAYGLAFDTLETLIADGSTEETVQIFQAPNGATSKKTIYKTYYHHAYPLGEAVTDPDLEAAYILDKNGHILPYVKFQGGSLRVLDAALRVLDAAATKPVNAGS